MSKKKKKPSLKPKQQNIKNKNIKKSAKKQKKLKYIEKAHLLTDTRRIYRRNIGAGITVSYLMINFILDYLGIMYYSFGLFISAILFFAAMIIGFLVTLIKTYRNKIDLQTMEGYHIAPYSFFVIPVTCLIILTLIINTQEIFTASAENIWFYRWIISGIDFGVITLVVLIHLIAKKKGRAII